MTNFDSIARIEFTIPRASLVERVTRWVPVFGWIIANELEKKRCRPALEAIAKQLIERPMPSRDIWGDSERGEFAFFLNDSIRKELGWPNGHFIPDDPFIAPFLNDDGASTAVITSAERYLGLPSGDISSAQLSEIMKMTFGQAIDYMQALKTTS